jgi:sulfite reductase (NADPH) hemoprotein beta-component
VHARDRAGIERLLRDYGIENRTNFGAARLASMACVALPTCALAMAESERYMPSFMEQLEKLLDEFGLRDVPIHVRMSGCPNGCSRPYLAEIALVGKAPGQYNLYLGASHSGERLNALYRENMDEQGILAALREPLLRYSRERKDAESFGDFVIRAGIVHAMRHGRDFQLSGLPKA